MAGVMAPPRRARPCPRCRSPLRPKTFGVNAFAPLLLTYASPPSSPACSKSGSPKVAVMSSRVGSIVDNSCTRTAHRASKAAANSVFKNVAVDMRGDGVAVDIVHPGIVRTPMTAAMGEGIPEAVGWGLGWDGGCVHRATITSIVRLFTL
ncbi:hypothetical protein F4813DRAFT_154805 [Daldinia decipiens]|uniref:uncharacterized protein n=1 Tax=Daldinia decipiens TaxID=326647 RepID=UPI0020C1D832|nr:uncharacterized protein F4813DRAFT_154805 [Daldinia decipiens]KAI1655818.1 hypothetical protein F4813DRAFT_154805 [Daldinia decipiens]